MIEWSQISAAILVTLRSYAAMFMIKYIKKTIWTYWGKDSHKIRKTNIEALKTWILSTKVALHLSVWSVNIVLRNKTTYY